MCPDLVPNEKKKVKRYIRGFPEMIKGNITSSKPTTLHEAINMDTKLVEQAVQAPAEGRGYAGNLPWCNRCKGHHQLGSCPPRCSKCHKLGHEDFRARIPVAIGNLLQNVTCFGCGEKGHYKDKCPRKRNPQNEGARGGAYLMSTEEPQRKLRDDGGTVNVQGYSHKTFMNEKPHPFDGTEGVVGLRHWIKKGHALTWWNGNVHTLGLVNANRIHWTEFMSMMTTEHCPTTEIQRIEQELWTLTMKGDDIEAYNNRFHELALMCPDLVPNEKKRAERYIQEFPERIKGNITSSKPTTLHEAINMARELVEQAVQGKTARMSESNKRKWKDQQVNNQQQNQRQETAKDYVAALAEGRGYARKLPWYNRCKAYHQPGLCPPRDKCPRGRNPQNKGVYGEAYLMRTEEPQLDPNVITYTS
nr:hypothetical protein [Tanacetum cinerariifolium]